MNNSLLGVLLRCRKEPIAVTANIQQMFYCFLVWENHRKYPRFLWHRDNDISKEITEYQMHVYVFGNSPFLASAIYGLRCAGQEGEQEHGSDNLLRDFYVDDGLISLSNEVDAVSLLKCTQKAIAQSNIKLHKIA